MVAIFQEAIAQDSDHDICIGDLNSAKGVEKDRLVGTQNPKATEWFKKYKLTDVQTWKH